MSRTFYIKNSKFPEIANMITLLTLQDDDKRFVQYNFQGWEENFEECMFQPMSENFYWTIGQEDLAGRGFQVNYEEEERQYGVRLATPSTEQDWLSAFEFIKKVAQHFGVDVIDEEGIQYAADNITYDYKKDITAGLNSFLMQIEKGYESQCFHSCIRPIRMANQELEKIRYAEDPVKYFGQLVHNQIYVDAHYLSPAFYEGSRPNEVLVVYRILEDTAVVMPYVFPPIIDPYTESTRDIRKRDTWEYIVAFFLFKNDGSEFLAQVPLEDFLKKLPEEKIQKLDSHYMKIQLSREDMESILL